MIQFRKGLNYEAKEEVLNAGGNEVYLLHVSIYGADGLENDYFIDLANGDKYDTKEDYIFVKFAFPCRNAIANFILNRMDEAAEF